MAYISLNQLKELTKCINELKLKEEERKSENIKNDENDKRKKAC